MAMIIKSVISLFIIIVVSIIFIQRVSNNKVSLGGYSLYTVITESMVPKYNVFDMIVTKEVNTNDIKVGDDVVYLGKKDDFAGKIVTHEVIKIDKIDGNTYFHTKGIANDIEDPLVSSDQIMGRVCFKSHILSLVSKIVNNIYGFYFVIFVPFAILLVMEIIDIVYERRDRKSQQVTFMDDKKKRVRRKRRIRKSTLFFLFLTLASNSFAWFIYSTKVSNNITAKVRSWHVNFDVSSGSGSSEYIEVNIDSVFPGMEDFYQEVTAVNNGEVDAKISYEIVSARIFDDDLIQRGLSSSSIIDSFKSEYPFVLSIGASNNIIAANGGEEVIFVSASWDYESGDDLEDTKWGNKAYDYHLNNPDSPSISILIKVSAIQM